MTFGAIGFLFAALAGIIPVILHMISHQRAKELPFSTLRFLRISVEKTRRRRRIQDLLLMLVRMAALILIALGLAKPALTGLSSLLRGGASTAVAIVLDNSASMGTPDQGRMRFETAVGAASQIMNELRPGDRAAIYLPCGPNFPQEGKLDPSHEKVRQIINQAAVSYERADLAVQVREARALLAKSDVPNKQIFVISDLQAVSWQGFREREPESADVPLIFVDCDRQPQPNVAVTDVQLEAAVPVAGLPVQAIAEVFNAAEEVQERRLELYVDGARQASSPDLKVPPEGRLKHEFQVTFQTGGLHQGEVRLVGDEGSKLDDRRFFTIEVNQGIPVAIVKAHEHEIACLDDSFYVEQALAPGRSGGWAVRPTSLTVEKLPTEPLADYKVVFCVNLPALDVDATQALRKYVAGGGSVVWICGDNVEPEAYNRMNEEAGGELLPAPLLEIRTPDPAEGRDSWNIASLDKDHPALRSFVEPASLYRSVLVYKHVRLDVERASGVRVLASLDDEPRDEPLLVERNVGHGTVIMLGTSAHVGWTNLPLRPLFLPLLLRLTFELCGTEPGQHEVLAGSPIVVPLEDETGAAMVEILPPSGQLRQEKAIRRGSFRYDDTHEVGVYRIVLLGTARRTQHGYSVNVDPLEADPAKITRAELEERFGTTPLVFADDPDDLAGTFTRLREGTSLWEHLLAAVLVVLVFETFVSNWLSPKQQKDEFEHLAPGMRRLARKGRSAA